MPQAPDAAPTDMIGDAWLIHHGIETSSWKDQACKAKALELVDETKLTQARLDDAMEMALHADTLQCSKARSQSGGLMTQAVERAVALRQALVKHGADQWVLGNADARIETIRTDVHAGDLDAAEHAFAQLNEIHNLVYDQVEQNRTRYCSLTKTSELRSDQYTKVVRYLPKAGVSPDLARTYCRVQLNYD